LYALHACTSVQSSILYTACMSVLADTLTLAWALTAAQ
jgi:hypothetical protein